MSTPLNVQEKEFVNEALLSAVQANDQKLVELCLQKGGDINTRDGYQRSLFMIAATRTRNVPLAKFLLKQKPDLLLKDEDGHTVFDVVNSSRFGSDYPDTQEKLRIMLLETFPDARSEEPQQDNSLAIERPISARRIRLLPKNKGGGFNL